MGKKSDFGEYYQINLELTKKKIKESVTKDLLLVQAINANDDLDRVFNMTSKRQREWAGYYLPELERKVEDNEMFVRKATGSNRKALLKELELKEDESMGSPFSKEDLSAFSSLGDSCISVIEAKRDILKYIELMMDEICPNLKAVAGTTIGARLLAHAGSLRRLMEYPSSTLQILGAEKALFRHIRNRKSRPPKYGLIHEHPLILNAPKKDHGKIARTLADKITIAVKVDYFKGDFIGDRLRQDIEKRFRR